uniref:Transposase n=1 Tax=Haemonchus contortus TaxID=6289 RepID=A0A7I4YF73_HAECO
GTSWYHTFKSYRHLGQYGVEGNGLPEPPNQTDLIKIERGLELEKTYFLSRETEEKRPMVGYAESEVV